MLGGAGRHDLLVRRQELPEGRALCAWMNGAWMNGLWRPQPESPVRCPEGRADTAFAAMIAYMKVTDKGP